MWNVELKIWYLKQNKDKFGKLWKDAERHFVLLRKISWQETRDLIHIPNAAVWADLPFISALITLNQYNCVIQMKSCLFGGIMTLVVSKKRDETHLCVLCFPEECRMSDWLKRQGETGRGT